MEEPHVVGERSHDFISLSSFGKTIRDKIQDHKKVTQEEKDKVAEDAAMEEDSLDFISLKLPGDVEEEKPLMSFDAPWAEHVYTHHNMTLRLHEEMLDFCAYMSPRPEEELERRELIARFTELCQDIWPGCELKPFGSFATRLYLPTSDIDIVLVGADGDAAGRLELLADEIRSADMASYLEVIGKAKIPIVKFTDKKTGLKMDVCFDEVGGLASAKLVNEKQQTMPALRPLVLFLKFFLQCRLLNETYSGGVGSYLLQLMVISFLQLQPSRVRAMQPKERRGEEGEGRQSEGRRGQGLNLGLLLYSFFDLYGSSFNYNNVSVSIKAKGSYFNKSARGWYNPDRPYLISMENPLNPSLDVGQNSYGMQRVRRAFQFAQQQLRAPEAAFKPRPPTLLSRLVCVRGELLRRRSDLPAFPGDNDADHDSQQHEKNKDQPKETTGKKKKKRKKRKRQLLKSGNGIYESNREKKRKKNKRLNVRKVKRQKERNNSS